MEFIGIDVHKRESQMCILAAGGEVVLEQRIRTERGRFAELLGRRPKARILREASTESEWVARCLEQLGHEVVVADPNFSPMVCPLLHRGQLVGRLEARVEDAVLRVDKLWREKGVKLDDAALDEALARHAKACGATKVRRPRARVG